MQQLADSPLGSLCYSNCAASIKRRSLSTTRDAGQYGIACSVNTPSVGTFAGMGNRGTMDCWVVGGADLDQHIPLLLNPATHSSRLHTFSKTLVKRSLSGVPLIVSRDMRSSCVAQK